MGITVITVIITIITTITMIKKKSSPCTIIAYTRITLILRTDADYAPPRNSDNGFIFHGSRRAAIDTSDGDGRGGGYGKGYGGDDIVRRPGG